MEGDRSRPHASPPQANVNLERRMGAYGGATPAVKTVLS